MGRRKLIFTVLGTDKYKKIKIGKKFQVEFYRYQSRAYCNLNDRLHYRQLGDINISVVKKLQKALAKLEESMEAMQASSSESK
jgi:hypothetical protein